MKVISLTPILNVSDVGASIRWFESLGWVRSFTWNGHGLIHDAALENEHGAAGFGGVCAPDDGPTVFLCQNAQGMRDPDTKADPARDDYGGVWMSWWVDNVNEAHGECMQAEIEIVRPPVDEPWGVREFLIRHPDGHYFRVSGPMSDS